MELLSSLLLICKNCSYDLWFLNFNVHLNHLKILLTCIMIQLGGAQDLTFLISSQMTYNLWSLNHPVSSVIPNGSLRLFKSLFPNICPLPLSRFNVIKHIKSFALSLVPYGTCLRSPLLPLGHGDFLCFSLLTLYFYFTLKDLIHLKSPLC